MFARFWGDRYFAATYWPNLGAVIVITPAEPDVTVIAREDVDTVIATEDPPAIAGVDVSTVIA